MTTRKHMVRSRVIINRLMRVFRLYGGLQHLGLLPPTGKRRGRRER